jgi:type 1 glutamine amidotransferase
MKRIFLLLGVAAVTGTSVGFGADKRIVLIAGRPSHPPGMHEFRAGCLLLKKCLEGVEGVTSVVYSNGWPHEARAFEEADAIFIYADGGAGHPAIQKDHLRTLEDLVSKGVGIGFGHYGVEIPSTNGGPQFLEWMGGYYEHLFSVNPIWKPEFTGFPQHPIARGLKPFAIEDEWYFNMRFRPDFTQYDASLKGVVRTRGVTAILVAKPPDAVRKGPYVYPKGPYPHIVEASGRDETMMWAYERPDGGRGFGFTGGHFHRNWGDDNFRKVVLNALLWIAKADVPANGVESTVSPEELQQNLDPKGRK